MEYRVNERLREIIIPDLAWFELILDRARDNITSLQICQTLTFLVSVNKDIEYKEETLFIITGKPMDPKGKSKRKKNKSEKRNLLTRREKRRRKES